MRCTQRIKERPGLRNFYLTMGKRINLEEDPGKQNRRPFEPIWCLKTVWCFMVCLSFARFPVEKRLSFWTMPRDHHEGRPKRYQKHMSCTPNPDSPKIARWQRCPGRFNGTASQWKHGNLRDRQSKRKTDPVPDPGKAWKAQVTSWKWCRNGLFVLGKAEECT